MRVEVLGLFVTPDRLLRSYAIQNSKCRYWCRLRGSAPFISPLNWTENGPNSNGNPVIRAPSEFLSHVFWAASLRAACGLSSSECSGSSRLRDEPGILQIPRLLDDEWKHTTQAHRSLPDHHLQNRRRRPNHRPNLIRLVS